MPEPVLLKIEGAVAHPFDVRYADLEAIPPSQRVDDVSRLIPNRRGDAVALEALLGHAQPLPEADFVTLHADRDDFHVSVPLRALRAEAVVLYRLEGRPLAPEQGGPIRLLIKDPAACHSSELDDCANVKYLSRIELTVRRGLDTRPADEASHAALHAAEKR